MPRAKKIKKQDGTPIANTDDPAVAADVAERLNDDEARREEDKWSAYLGEVSLSCTRFG